MSEDLLTSASPWPELSDLDGFWDPDETPPRGVPRLDVEAADDEEDDPTPINGPRPAPLATLPPPSTPAVAGPPPAALAEPLSRPTGAPNAPPSPARLPEHGGRRWPRRVGGLLLVVALAAVGALAWRWNERPHEDASAAGILPSSTVAGPDVAVVEFEIARDFDVVVSADLETGEALAVVSGGLSIARVDGTYWASETGVEDWTPASPTLLGRHATIVEMIEAADVVTVTDVFPAAVHPYLDVVGDRSAVVPDVAPSGTTVVAVSADATVRQLTLRVDREALSKDEPFLARRLQLTGDGPVDVAIWVDRTGVLWRLSAPSDVTAIGGEYRLVAPSNGPGPLDAFDPATFDTAPSEIVPSDPPATPAAEQLGD